MNRKSISKQLMSGRVILRFIVSIVLLIEAVFFLVSGFFRHHEAMVLRYPEIIDLVFVLFSSYMLLAMGGILAVVAVHFLLFRGWALKALLNIQIIFICSIALIMLFNQYQNITAFVTHYISFIQFPTFDIVLAIGLMVLQVLILVYTLKSRHMYLIQLQSRT